MTQQLQRNILVAPFRLGPAAHSQKSEVPDDAGLLKWLVRKPVGRFFLRHRIWILSAGHVLVFLWAYWMAFAFRFDFEIPDDYVAVLWNSLPLVLVTKLVVFYSLGHFHGWWRYVTFSDLVALLKASVVSLLMLVVFNHYILAGRIPRTVVLVDSLFCLLALGCLRASWRLYREQLAVRWNEHRRALMVGCDERNAMLAHRIHSDWEVPLTVVGLLDGDEARLGARMGGIPIVGTWLDLEDAVVATRAREVLVGSDTLTGKQLRDLMDRCDQANVQLKVIPSIHSHLNGTQVAPIRDVDIEDLLRREPVRLDLEAIGRELRGQTILVTGAGGSIGSEICRQLLPFEPSHLILVDHGENALFLIDRELTLRKGETVIVPRVADILDATAMGEIFRRWRPEVVLHAAARKHVGLMEDNVAECVRNNLFGTKSVADLANAFEARKFVLISTDKAVNPTSVMGASKQMAERYVNALDKESKTAFIVVRFGNVLGSNGSVVPLFKQQIEQGGPITITDERMTRFFMTIPEASQLVLQAASMGRGGEVFVLSMGEQIRIIDLARDLIRLSGLPKDAIEIRYVGMRPGEKLYEELYSEQEALIETPHPKVMAAYHRAFTVEAVRSDTHRLEQSLRYDDAVIRRLLQELIPEYVAGTPAAQPTESPGPGAFSSGNAPLSALAVPTQSPAA